MFFTGLSGFSGFSPVPFIEQQEAIYIVKRLWSCVESFMLLSLKVEFCSTQSNLEMIKWCMCCGVLRVFSEFLQRLSLSLQANPLLPLTVIDLSENAIDDRGECTRRILCDICGLVEFAGKMLPQTYCSLLIGYRLRHRWNCCSVSTSCVST